MDNVKKVLGDDYMAFGGPSPTVIEVAKRQMLELDQLEADVRTTASALGERLAATDEALGELAGRRAELENLVALAAQAKQEAGA